MPLSDPYDLLYTHTATGATHLRPLFIDPDTRGGARILHAINPTTGRIVADPITAFRGVVDAPAVTEVPKPEPAEEHRPETIADLRKLGWDAYADQSSYAEKTIGPHMVTAWINSGASVQTAHGGASLPASVYLRIAVATAKIIEEAGPFPALASPEPAEPPSDGVYTSEDAIEF